MLQMPLLLIVLKRRGPPRIKAVANTAFHIYHWLQGTTVYTNCEVLNIASKICIYPLFNFTIRASLSQHRLATPAMRSNFIAHETTGVITDAYHNLI